ncbi:MAG: hypothetical protein ACK5HY_00210 [Parahaliea sp.]
MNTVHLSLLALLGSTLIGCSDELPPSREDQPYASAPAYNMAPPPRGGYRAQQMTGADIGQTRYFHIPDPETGMSVARLPLPASWRELGKDSEFAYAGPDNIRVSQPGGALFYFSNDPQMQQIIQAQGNTLLPPMSIGEIIQKFFMPPAQQKGRTLRNTYELPQLVAAEQRAFAQMYRSVAVRHEARAYALEWTDNQGMSYVSVVTVNTNYGPASGYWMFSSLYLQAPHAVFTGARDALINGLALRQHNPQWIAMKNQQAAQRSQQQQREHEVRMASIRPMGNTSTNVGNTYSEILDISHRGYKDRSAMTDIGQQRAINGISEHTIIASPGSGQQYEVQSGSGQFWVNPHAGPNGQYIGSDNPLWDPRLVPGMNQQPWELYEEVQ